MPLEIVISFQGSPGVKEIVQQLAQINVSLAALVAQGGSDAADEAAAKRIAGMTGQLTSAIPASAG